MNRFPQFRNAHAAEPAQFQVQRLDRECRHRRDVPIEVARPQPFVAWPETRGQGAFHAAGQRPHQSDAEQVEDAVKQRQADGRRRVQPECLLQPVDSADQPRQQQQRDESGDQVEQHVCGGRPSRIRRRAEGGENRRDGGADVGADDAGGRLRQRQHAGLGEGQHDGEGGAGRLHQHRQHCTGQDECQRRQHAVAAEPGQIETLAAVRERLLHEADADEQHAESGQYLTDRWAPALTTAELQCHADADQRQRGRLDLDLQSNQGHQPAGHRGADVGAEQDPQGLAEGQQPGIDETDRGDRDRRRRLHQGGHQDSGGEASQPGLGGGGQQSAQGRAGRQLEAVGHQCHAQQEQADTAKRQGQR